jgi:alanine racemase
LAVHVQSVLTLASKIISGAIWPQHAPSATPVSIDGQPGRLIGRVSMNSLCVDLTDLPAARLGSWVELWGKQVLASTVAACAQHHPVPDSLQFTPRATALLRALMLG